VCNGLQWILELVPSKHKKVLDGGSRADREPSTSSREIPIYALVVAKGGVKFSETKPENRSDFGPPMSYNATRVTCKQVTMHKFAQVVPAGRMGRPVLDRTGLTGDYDLHMEFAPEAPAPKPGEAVASEPTGPSFMMALQEKLGLKLETTKGPVEFLVIDRIERPSAN
jgi:uncharacterized protein (TIGR03435 family)